MPSKLKESQGQTVVSERVTFTDGVRKIIPREKAEKLYEAGVARPERKYTPPQA